MTITEELLLMMVCFVGLFNVMVFVSRKRRPDRRNVARRVERSRIEHSRIEQSENAPVSDVPVPSDGIQRR